SGGLGCLDAISTVSRNAASSHGLPFVHAEKAPLSSAYGIQWGGVLQPSGESSQPIRPGYRPASHPRCIELLLEGITITPLARGYQSASDDVHVRWRTRINRPAAGTQQARFAVSWPGRCPVWSRKRARTCVRIARTGNNSFSTASSNSISSRARIRGLRRKCHSSFRLIHPPREHRLGVQ